MEPGKYIGEVKVVKEKTTRSGDNMWSLKFVDSEGSVLCWDNLTFSKAARGMAMKKIAILGVPKNSEGFYEINDKDELIGLRARLDLKKGTYKDNDGNTHERLEPNFYGEGKFGYSPEAIEPEIIKDDIPF